MPYNEPSPLETRIVSKRFGLPNSASLDTYLATDGFQAFRKALEMPPEAIIEEVKTSALRGRGGAGFPTGLKWSFVPRSSPKPKYIVINGDESEPGTFNNRILIEEDPHQVLEGIILACYATRASIAYFYLRFEYGTSYRVFQKAIDDAYAANLLGRNIQGKDFHLDVYMHRGAGAYICGEETGLIESLEGKRAWPRIKPPFPAVEGAFRKPTVVNNVETLCCVTHILGRGVEWFKSIGIPPDPNNPLPKFSPPRRVPHGVTLLGRLFEEGTVARAGLALERAFGMSSERPPGF